MSPVGESAGSHSTGVGLEVDPDSVAGKAERLVSGLKKGRSKCIWAAEILDFVHNKISYDHSVSSGFNRPPEVVLEKGGNCVDQSVLLSSLLESLDVVTRIVSADKMDGSGTGHDFVEVFLKDRSYKRICNQLDSFYRRDKNLHGFHHWFWVDEDRGGFWFFADPTRSDYLGDIQELVEDEYVEETDDGIELDVNQRMYPGY